MEKLFETWGTITGVEKRGADKPTHQKFIVHFLEDLDGFEREILCSEEQAIIAGANIMQKCLLTIAVEKRRHVS
jgi:hypothetical protein